MSQELTLYSSPQHETLNRFFETRTSVHLDVDGERATEDCCLVLSDQRSLSFRGIVDPEELRQRCIAHEISVPVYYCASSIDDLREPEAAGTSLILRAGPYCRYVQFAADAGLAYHQLAALGEHSTVVIETLFRASVHWVLGMAHEGKIVFQDIVDVQCQSDVFQFAMGLSCPSRVNDEQRLQLRDLAIRVVEALDVRDGAFRIECLLGNEPMVTEVDLGWFNQVMPVDVFALAGGEDYWKNQCGAIGVACEAVGMKSGFVSLKWLYSRSGIVEGFDGVDAASKVPGVHDVHLNARVGVSLGHVIDVVSRDALGYAVATGSTREEAEIGSMRAVGLIDIQRKTVL
ncbi:MAG: hypothetical protein VCD00_02200 [Candidatus Hydrogenedentota bacterium]